MDPYCQQGTVSAGGGSIMLRVAFTWSGLDTLVKLDKSLAGNDYLSFLETMHFMYPNKDGVFMDDSASCHRARTVRD